VILATDGDFNVGVTSRSELLELIEREREHGVFLTVLGVGTGNLDDAGMEQLADHGNGNYAYLDSLAEARKVLEEEAGGTLVTVAKDVKVQVEFNPRHVAAYRLIGYENRLLAARDFDDDAVDAGEIGAGHSVTALYEIVPPGFEEGVDLGAEPALRYQRGARESFGHREELALVRLRFKEPLGDESRLVEQPVSARAHPLAEASDDLRFAASVALFGMLLRDSPHAGSGDWNLVRELASGAVGADPRGLRTGFVGLASLAERLPEEQREVWSLSRE
jgi:Ca-activated chloride channel family protein